MTKRSWIGVALGALMAAIPHFAMIGLSSAM
jgi:hypothetical protein